MCKLVLKRFYNLTNSIGTLNILESIKSCKLENKKQNFIKHQPLKCLEILINLKLMKR